MNILVLSQFYSPDITAAAFRIGETVSYLAEVGNSVCVITAEPHKAVSEESQGIEIDKVVENVSVLRSPIVSEGQGGLIAYLRHYLSFMLGSLKMGITLRFSGWKPDILWATSPPLFTSISGFVLSKLFCCPFVLDIRDIWPDSAVSAKQISNSGIAYKIGKILEKLSYKWADSITTVSNPMAAYIRKYTRKPVQVVYNGISEKYLKKQESLGLVNRIIYAGNLGRVQGLESFIKALSIVNKVGLLKGWHAVLLGSGANREKLLSLISKSDVAEKIHICPPVEKETAIMELSLSRLLFINLNRDPVFKLTIPSKVFDYMSVGRPILAGLGGEGRVILESTGANIIFPASDVYALQASIVKAINSIESLESRAKLNREAVSKVYTREQSCVQLVKLFSYLTKSDR